MAFNFKEKMQGLVQKVTTRREEGQRPPLSTMPNGSVSGFVPKVSRRRPEEAAQGAHPATGFMGMVPPGIDPAAMGQYMPPMQQPQQGAAVPPQQPWGQQPPQQPYGNQASSRPMPPPQQPVSGTMRQGNVQGYQPRHQAPQQTGWQPVFPQNQPFAQPQAAPVQPQQPAPQQPAPQNGGNVTYFPGTVVDEEGAPYSMTLRVAQITGIASCYRLLEFMQNNETVIVNAEQITDAMEASRCMDMLFGAAYAMNQNFERIASRMIYLIAPRHVHVLPYESMLHLSQQDIERRWPGSARASGQEARRPASRQEDFAPAFGQHAAAAPQTQYTGFGGFGAFGGRR